jgi:LysR family transcriptional regulator, glycine cleavage system transcriptional activator
MADRLSSLTALRAFEAAARHRSFKKAAGELHVTTAAVSQQVKLLELDLGVKLLRRQDGQWQLTEAGRAGIADLRQGFENLVQGLRKIRSSRGRRRLTVSVVPSFAATWLVSRLERFRAAHSDIDLLLDATMAVADLARGDADMAVRYGSGDFPGLHCVRLLADDIFPVCSPRLLEGRHPLRKPEDLRHHTLLHSDWNAAPGGWPDWPMWLRSAGVAGIVDAERGPRFSQHSMAIQAAIEGQGVALGTTSHAANDLDAGRLVWPFDHCLPTPFAYYVVSPPETAEEPAIAAFRDWLIAEAQGSRAPS